MLRIALALSAGLHAALGVWVEVRHLAPPHASAVAVVDPWVGRGIEVDADTTESAVPTPATTSEQRATRAPSPAVTHPAPAPLERSAPLERAAPIAREARTAPKSPAAAPAAPASNEAVSASASQPASTSASSGAFGAEGLPVGVRHLPKAFTRALGLASRGDPRWLTLPVGNAGEARIRLEVDEEGRLGELEYSEPDTARTLLPVVRHLLENTRLLLVTGRFSLDPTRARGGAERLRVRVEIVEGSAAADPDADPNGLRELEYEAPSGDKPGRGSFRLNSGRRVIGWVTVERSP